jgi:type I site-specific restriction endonuclease
MRPYQVEANTAIEQAIRDRKRKMLVAMATGTGKTLTMVNEVYRLMKSVCWRTMSRQFSPKNERDLPPMV